MIRTDVVIFKVMIGETCTDSFTTAQFLTQESALAQARIARDKLNASEYGVKHGAPWRIVRAFRSHRVKPL